MPGFARAFLFAVLSEECRPREGGDPVNTALTTNKDSEYWMPAFAGMTDKNDGRGAL
jgi:hypothetical protein